MQPSSNGGPPISRAGSGLPSRIIFHGVEGIGKTSLFANAPSPLFLMTGGETGLLTLIDNGLISETDHFDPVATWQDLCAAINWLIVEPRGNKTLIIDTMNGAEWLCFDHTTKMRCDGDRDKFLAYGRGVEQSLPFWQDFLALLDRLREVRRMMIVLLCHTKIKTFKNPEGDDYDRYMPDMHEKTWGLAAKWADVVLFGNHETFAKKTQGASKAKGFSGGRRLLYTTRSAAYDAKNRLGLPKEIDMGATGFEAWGNFSSAVRAAKQANQPVPVELKGGAA